MTFNFKNLFGKVEKAAPVSGSGNLANPFAILLGSGGKIGAAEAMSYYNGWVYACIRAIAEEVASIQWHLFKQATDGTLTEEFNSDLIDLLNAPNRYQTGYDFRFNIAAHLESCGNAYIYLGEVNSETDKPKSLQLLNPAKVTIRKADFPDFIAGYNYNDNGKIVRIETYQMLHIKYSDPSDPFYGLGTVQAGIDWIKAEEYQTQFNLRYFKNGARIGGFIESENAQTAEQLEYLKRSFEKAASGIENAHKTLALPKGTKYIEGSTNQKDMDFYNGQIVLRDKILAIFRVPKTVLGITDDVNRANAEATNYVFALRTILPKDKLITDYLNEFLVPRFEDKAVLHFDNPVPEDKAAKMEEMKAGIANQPVISVNEARSKYYGLEEIDGGDAVMGSFNMSPIGSPKPKPEPTKDAPAHSFFRKSRIAIEQEKRKSLTNEIVKGIGEILSTLKSTTKKDISQLSEKEFEPIYKAFAVRVGKYEKKQKENVIKFNDKMRAKVLDVMNDVKVTKAMTPEEAFTEIYAMFDQDALADFVDINKANLYDLYETEGVAAASLVGFDNIEVMTPEAKAALDRALSLLSESYSNTTRDLLNTKLTQALTDGVGFDKMTDIVNEVFDFSDEVRAGQVARTETFRIANESTKNSWKETGVVKTIKWFTAEDERVCDFCGPMHETVIPIDDNFFNNGDTVKGDNGQEMTISYDDVGAPPLHVTCRCYQRPEEISIE